MVAADRHRPDAGARQAAQLRGQCDAARHVPDPVVEDVAGQKQRRHVLLDRRVDKARERKPRRPMQPPRALGIPQGLRPKRGIEVKVGGMEKAHR
jgi:hypothetical protein